MRIVPAAIVAAVLLIAASGAMAYSTFGFSDAGRQIVVRWHDVPVRYYVNDTGSGSVTPPGLREALDRAFGRWQLVESAAIAYEFAGFTSAAPGDEDGRNTIGFLARPELDRVLAATSFLVDDLTGELLESDIFFNTAFPWSTAPGGDRGGYDLESIAVHEIGHLSGLGHSALGETQLGAGGRQVLGTASVMFPLAFGPGSIANRELYPDDIAGLSHLYPPATSVAQTGTISGRVLLNGRGIFGAHVIAVHPGTGEMIGSFSVDQGRFAIAGLAPGPYVLRVEPVDDAELESFFDRPELVATGFGATFHDRLVTVPEGGDSGQVDLVVRSR
jgi:hypothetical protein